MSKYVESIPNSELSHLLEERVFLAARFKLFMGLSDLCQEFNVDHIYNFRVGIQFIFNCKKLGFILAAIFMVYFIWFSKSHFGTRFLYIGLFSGIIQLVAIAIEKSYIVFASGFVDNVNVNFRKHKCLGESKMSKALFHAVNDVSEFFEMHGLGTKCIFAACAVLIVVGLISKLFVKKGDEKLLVASVKTTTTTTTKKMK